VGYITGTDDYVLSVRASVPVSSTVLRVSANGSSQQFTVTQRLAHTFALTQSVTMPAMILIENTGSSEMIIQYVSLVPVTFIIHANQDPGGGATTAPSPFDLGQFYDLFVPWSLAIDPTIAGAFNLDLGVLTQQAGRAAASIFEMASPQILQYYIGARVVMLGLAWFANFVTSRIGLHNVPAEGGDVYVDARRSRRQRDRIKGLDTAARAHTFAAGRYGRKSR
jgi:hypothetical protein